MVALSCLKLVVHDGVLVSGDEIPYFGRNQLG